MPDWLVQSLRESGGGHAGTAKRCATRSHVQIEGPDSVNTPDAVKEFIAQSCAIMPTNVGSTKWLGDGAGYAISTNVLDCIFKMAAHKSNRQFIFVSTGGDMSRRCHDGECRDRCWGQRKLPGEVLQAIQGLFTSKAVVDPELVELARKEAADHLNDAVPGNNTMSMVLNSDSSGFEGSLKKFYNRDLCFMCGKGTLLATTNSRGLAISCDNASCSFKMPASGGISIPTEKYANLGKFFVIIQQLNITNNNTTNNFAAVGLEDMPSLFLGDEVVVRDNADLNTLILDALDGSDSTLARLFAHIHRGRIVYASDERWYIFRGHRWVCEKVPSLTELIDDPLTSEFRRVLNAAVPAYKKSDVGNKEAKIKRILSTLQSLKSDSKQNLIFSQCRKRSLLGDTDGTFLENLDANPLLLGFTNGVYDLKEHVFRAGASEDYLTMTVGYNYNPALMSDMHSRSEVEQFFDQVFPDAGVRHYVLLFLASTLEGYNKEHRFHFAHGSSGRNGKGVLMKIMEQTLGKYAVSVNSALICGKSGDANAATPQLTMMVNKRFAYMSEVQEGARINEELFKRLSGGDRLQTRELFKEMREVENTAKMLMCCNDMPKIDGSKQANVPRIVIIPFMSRFKEGECDPKKNEFPVDRTLETRVSGWKHAMMGILLEYHKEYSCNGLGILPEAMKKVKADYLGANDPNSLIEQYVKERLSNTGEGVGTEHLLSDYRKWERDLGVAHPHSGKNRLMVHFFDRLLMSDDQIRKVDGGEKVSNMRRYGKERKAGYAGWSFVDCQPSAPHTVTSLAGRNGACAMWNVDRQMCLPPGRHNIDWMETKEASILAGKVAEAQVKHYLCSGVENDWRKVMRECMDVTLETQREMNTYFTEREASVRDAVQLIKSVTNVISW
ncbi:hypothetical protein HDU93_001806, partial [Gonapodya sp. JEL0774]